MTYADLNLAMWQYTATVLDPARVLKKLSGEPPQWCGLPPSAIPRPGLGPRFSLRPELSAAPLRNEDGAGDGVSGFEPLPGVYAEYAHPMANAIFSEAFAIMAPFIAADARVLDAGCGPGTEALRVARHASRGEVVGVDLAAGMVIEARRAARASGLNNLTFIQADVANLPHAFDAGFDVVYSCLAHHHYGDPLAAARSIRRCLRAGGISFVVDAGPAWYIELSTPLARAADPGWVGFTTPDEFRALMARAGFERSAWVDVLPGYGIAAAQKDRGVRG